MTRCMVALVLVLAASTAYADIQKSGPEELGKLQVGAHIGGQFGWTGWEPSGFRFDADVAGKIKDMDKLSLWLGGGIDAVYGYFYCTGVGCGSGQFGFWVFVEASLEKLFNIPLVPYFRAGPGGEILFYNETGGAFVIRIASGIHYFLTKNIGLGGEIGTSLGWAAYGIHGVGNGFYGDWDARIGARFTF